MSSFLYGRFTNSSPPAGIPANARLVDVATLEQAKFAIQSGNAGLAPESQTQIETTMQSAIDTKPTQPEPSKLDQLLEGLLGIVPLEGIAVWVIATEAFSNITAATAPEDDKAATLTITQPNALIWAIGAAMVVALVACIFGRRNGNDSKQQSRPIWVALIPPAAMFLWAYITEPSALRTAMGQPERGAEWIVAVAAGFIVIMLAIYVGLTKDKSTAPAQPVVPAPAA